MKNKLFLRFLSFVFLMMVSGISFAMKNGIVMAANLPIISMVLHPKNNAFVAILRHSKVNDEQQVAILYFGTEKYEILHDVVGTNDKPTGIVFDENGKVRLKNVSEEKYELKEKEEGHSFYHIYNKENNKYWSESVSLKKGSIFAVSPDERYVAVVENTMMRAYLQDKYGSNIICLLKANIAATALIFGNKNTLLVSYADNSIEEVKFTLDDKKVGVRENTYHLNRFVSGKVIQELDEIIKKEFTLEKTPINSSEIRREELTPTKAPINPGWRWTLPKMRIVMLSSIFLAVAFLLYSQYFSRMSV